MRWILPALLLVALALLPGVASANPQQAFQPAYDIVSLTPNTANANGTIVQHIRVPATDHSIGSIKFTLPPSWGIVSVQQNDDLPVVGTGLLLADVQRPRLKELDARFVHRPFDLDGLSDDLF